MTTLTPRRAAHVRVPDGRLVRVDLVPLSQIPERRPYRVDVDLDAPRVV